MNEYYKKHNIKWYYVLTKSASIAKRFNRTLIDYIYKSSYMFNEFNIFEIINDYNNTYHGVLNNTPHEIYINDKNINVEIEDANEKEMFKPGDNVRILLKRFDKKTKHNWSEEIFKIKTSVKKNGVYGYYLNDILGVFYTNELMKA